MSSHGPPRPRRDARGTGPRVNHQTSRRFAATGSVFRPTASEERTGGHSPPPIPMVWVGGDAVRDAQADVPWPKASGATCVQKLDGSRDSAIHTKYRISLRSSSMREPRYPLPRVVLMYRNDTTTHAHFGQPRGVGRAIVHGPWRNPRRGLFVLGGDRPTGSRDLAELGGRRRFVAERRPPGVCKRVHGSFCLCRFRQ